MEKVFFVVERDFQMREVPAKYHGEIWRSATANIVYAYKLDGVGCNLSCAELFAIYEDAKSLDALPPSNVEGYDYAGKY